MLLVLTVTLIVMFVTAVMNVRDVINVMKSMTIMVMVAIVIVTDFLTRIGSLRWAISLCSLSSLRVLWDTKYNLISFSNDRRTVRVSKG